MATEALSGRAATGWRGGGRWNAASGFTLIELTLVVLVLGIVATMAVPLMSTVLTEARLNAAASEIVTAIEYAQLTALGTRSPCRVTIDAVAGTLLVERVEHDSSLLGAQAQLPEATVEAQSMVRVPHPMLPFEDYEVDFTDPNRFSGVELVSATFGGANFIEFQPLGMPSSGGTVTMTAGDFQVVLTVDALSGRVTQN